MFPVVLTLFTMMFLDTMGTLIGIKTRAGFLDKDGNVPRNREAFPGRRAGDHHGRTREEHDNGVFVESAPGIEQGGRTGIVAIVVGGLLLLALFLCPALLGDFQHCPPDRCLFLLGL